MSSSYKRTCTDRKICQSVIPASIRKANKRSRIHTFQNGRVHLLQRANNVCPVHIRLYTCGSWPIGNWPFHRGPQESQIDPDRWGISAGLTWGQNISTRWRNYKTDTATPDRSDSDWLVTFQKKDKEQGHSSQVAKGVEETLRIWAERCIFWL